jgi:iron complex outermembrane receptor protein
MFYASYQQAQKSGTYNTVAIYEPPAYVKPEKVNAYEVGVKTRLLDGLLTLSAAGFQYDIRDFQVQFISLIQGGAVSFENAQAARIQGAELESGVVLLPQLVDGLVLNLGGAYLDAQYTDYTGASGFDPVTGIYRSDNNFTGKRIVRTPRYSGTAALTKTWRTGRGPLELGADVYANSGFFYAASNADNSRQAAYTVAGAHASFEYEPWNLRTTLYGRNLKNQKYSQGEIGTDFGTNVTLASPRVFGANLELRY